jgi:hypothetical protein
MPPPPRSMQERIEVQLRVGDRSNRVCVEGGQGSPGVTAAGKLVSYDDRRDLTLIGRSLFLDDPNTT